MYATPLALWHRFSAYSSTEWTYGSPRLERYNGIPSMEILGEAVAWKSTGDAMKFMADLS
ncbi:efflux RND transporter permease subunit [Escherichia coli]